MGGISFLLGVVQGGKVIGQRTNEDSFRGCVAAVSC
jgi:hypothetical protein